MSDDADTTRHLSADEWRALGEVLEHPPEPSEDLRAILARKPSEAIDEFAARQGAIRFGKSADVDDEAFWDEWQAAGCRGAEASHLWGLPTDRLELALRKYWRAGDTEDLHALMLEAWGERSRQ